MPRSARGARLIYAYEEALGYAVSDAVADKDGISAAVLACGVAVTRAAAGSSLVGAYDDLEAEHGVHLTRQLSFRREGASGRRAIEAVVRRLATEPPAVLGGLAVTSAEDLEVGVDGLAPTEGTRLRAGDAVRVVVRPSGTEPKLKAYVEVVAEPVAAGSLEASRAGAASTLDAVCVDVVALCGSAGSTAPQRFGVVRSDSAVSWA